MNKCSALLCHTWKELRFSCGNIDLLSAKGLLVPPFPLPVRWMLWFMVLFSGKAFFFSALIRGFVEESSICYLHVLGDLRRVGEEAQMAAWPARVFILEDLLP